MSEQPHPVAELPLVVVAGMSRAGTTFLYHNLQRHPRIFLPRRKEVCWFAHNHDHGEDWFRGFYRQRASHQVAFDICGHYLFHPEALERLARFDPDARVVLGLRDPVEWAFSLYEQYAGLFDVPPLVDFYRGCTIAREGKEIRFDFQSGMVERAVEQFAEAFGDRLLIYDFRLLGDDALAVLSAIEELAGIESHFAPGNFADVKINARGRKRSELLERLFQLRGVANLVSRLVPRHLLLTVRGFMERRAAQGTRKVSNAPEERFTPEEIACVEALFGPDRRYVRELFTERRLLSGDDIT